ncbi:MAG: O-acetyl-ADP-ribose deacetylase [Bacteroidetes bacterium]|nr:O-acetyl-ADP-ribose deacetylase [Bacteroidota bacterium]MCB0841985.1 O-acetyl-ADP-ribose deacetylase [Bacteroidota bacterium]
MKTKLKTIQGDITKVNVDVIVNAANSSLLGGGGVDGAIHRAGGKAILDDCMKIWARQGGCKTGEAVITTAGKLPAKYVVHTVGPVWNSAKKDEMDQLLSNCYLNSLNLAVENQAISIAFPNISTGIYRFPKTRAAEVAVSAVNSFLETNPESLNEILFVCYDMENFQLYRQLIVED